MDCLFCNIISGKVPSLKIYEDSDFLGILDIRPANKGHIILMPKKHTTFISEMDDSDVCKLFVLAKDIALNTVNKVGAKAFNLVYSAGQQAGQQTPHAFVNIIPRFDRDNVNISWEPVQLTQQEYMKLQNELLYSKPVKITEKREVIKKEPRKNQEGTIYKQSPQHPGYW